MLGRSSGKNLLEEGVPVQRPCGSPLGGRGTVTLGEQGAR